MIKIALCDDNELANEITCSFLEEFAKSRFVEIGWKYYVGATELLSAVENEGRFDIYLIDMIMPEMNGIELACELRRQKDKGRIVFLTASSDYIMESFEVRASNYLLKPLDKKKLFAELDRLCAEIREEEIGSVYVKTKKNVGRFIRINDINYVESVNRFPFYHLSYGEVVKGVSFRCGFGIKIDELINKYGFAKAGESMVVNLSKVTGIDRKGPTVYFSDGSEAPCSRSRIKDLKDSMRARLK